MSSLNDRIAGLANMPPAALRAEWRRLYREPAPSLSIDLLARGIAWRMQEKQHGGLVPAIERDLVRLAAHDTPPDTAKPAALRVGTVLVRDWHGQTHRVVITEAGYQFNDQTHTSLSSIAYAITGTKWSGPRFFGLKDSNNTQPGRGKRHA